jgi:hypothetical protein
MNITLQGFSFFKENTLRLRFKYESFCAIHENNHSVFLRVIRGHINTLFGRNKGFGVKIGYTALRQLNKL